MLVSDFDFALPESLIAQQARPRGQSRLMVVDRASGTWTDAMIADLPALLSPRDLLVVNDTRVFPARLLGRRDPSGGAAECFLLTRLSDTDWEALVSPGGKLQPGARVVFEAPAGAFEAPAGAFGAPAGAFAAPASAVAAPTGAGGVRLRGDILARGARGRRVVRFTVEGASSVDAAIDQLGHVPLPPYIRRPDTAEDRARYQTVYARARGSVAAPTAGLHFDEAALTALEAQGVERAALTLHVGYATFKPVTADRVEDHIVDVEPYEISANTAAAIAAARARGNRVVAVGTTTTRALEHAAARAHGVVEAGAGVADLFIYPGHRFAAVDALLTNFHLPASSLLMLVAAFGGRELVLDAYRAAVARGYHFYSYGDAMVIL